jgi:hypothetical protein
VRKVRILVIGPPALCQVIEHLFRDQREFEVVGSLGGLRSMVHKAGRLCPELIVANVKPVRVPVVQAVAFIKRSSPSSKLILICSIREFMAGARKSGADACLEPEKLVRCLLTAACALSERPKVVAPFSTSKMNRKRRN